MAFSGKFDGMKIFSATMAKDRESLGERITEWMNANKDSLTVIHTEVTQSSDSEFHCISITVLYTGQMQHNAQSIYGSRK